MTLLELALQHKALGKSTFQTPAWPCKRGHTERYTRNAACVECSRTVQRQAQKKYYQNNIDLMREKSRQHQKEYRRKHPEKVKAAVQEWKRNNQERYKTYQTQYRQMRRKKPLEA